MAQVRLLLSRPPPKRNLKSYRKVRFRGRCERLHRVVMEILLGRPLSPAEWVHHIDGNGLNNRPENLQIVSHGFHSSQHSRLLPMVRSCPICHRPFLARFCHRHQPKRCCSRPCAGKALSRRRRSSRPAPPPRA